MGRMYYAVIEAVSVSAICEIFAVKSASTKATRLHELSLTQDTSETSEQLPLGIYRTATDQSAKGTGVTPSPVGVGDAAFAGVVRTNILTADTFATLGAPLWRDSQNLLAGWHFLPKEQGIIDIPPSGLIVVKLPTAPSGATSFSGYLLLEEIG